MFHFIGLAFSLISLGLVCATYFSLKPSETESWLHGEIYLSILVSSLTGFFLLAVAVLVKDLWPVVTVGDSQATIVSLTVDLISAGVIFATLTVFRASLKLASQQAKKPGTISPFPTRPVTPQPPVHIDRKAA